MLKVDYDRLEIHRGNTDNHLPWSSYQAGSVTMFTHTRTNYVAAMDALDKMKRVAADTMGGQSDDYDIDGQRVFRIDNQAMGMSYGAIAARAIQLGGIYSGEEYPEDINEITERAVQGIAGSGLVGVGKDNLPQDGVIPGLAVAFCEIELDLETGKRTEFVGVRGSCWLGQIPAGGLLLAPESGAGCSCTHAIQTSMAFVPEDD